MLRHPVTPVGTKVPLVGHVQVVSHCMHVEASHVAHAPGQEVHMQEPVSYHALCTWHCRCEEALTRLEAWQGVAVRTMESGATQVAQLKQTVQEKTEQLALLQAECDGLQASKYFIFLFLLEHSCLLVDCAAANPSFSHQSFNQ